MAYRVSVSKKRIWNSFSFSLPFTFFSALQGFNKQSVVSTGYSCVGKIVEQIMVEHFLDPCLQTRSCFCFSSSLMRVARGCSLLSTRRHWFRQFSSWCKKCTGINAGTVCKSRCKPHVHLARYDYWHNSFRFSGKHGINDREAFVILSVDFKGSESCISRFQF